MMLKSFKFARKRTNIKFWKQSSQSTENVATWLYYEVFVFKSFQKIRILIIHACYFMIFVFEWPDLNMGFD